jgi:hypothetical protein
MMRQLLSAPAHDQRPAPLAVPHLVPLAGEWALWRDIAVRTAGFPVSGLGVFGSQNERAALRAVARDPLFQTAVTWQNRAAMHNAVGKIAGGAPAPASRQRQREETDFDSPVLARILCRQLRRAAADTPGRPARFTEMLPAPDDCWLADQDGRRYTSELRLIAVDLDRRTAGSEHSRVT